MAFPMSLLFFLIFSFPFAESQLSLDYYKQSCPNLEKVVQEAITTKQMTNPTTAAGTLRLLFHDCMVEGCDASVLIASNHVNKAERDADINLSLAGDGFDIVTRIKTALELSCPGIVSCSDILSLTTRALITAVGGPFYQVRLGRKDGLVSQASRVQGNLPTTNMTVDDMIKYFTSKSFTIQEMVALMGAHTIGFSHCSEFGDRLYHYSKDTPTDPSFHPKYAEALKKLCANYKTNPGISAFNDAMTPSKFDNMYYQNVQRGMALLASDSLLSKDPRTKPIIDLYAKNQTAFFNDFSHVMDKLSDYGIKTGTQGEVRRRCDSFNSVQA